jgi:hypothetical protein
MAGIRGLRDLSSTRRCSAKSALNFLSVEPEVALNRILRVLYRRARFDLWLDYTQPPIPPLAEAHAAWAQEIITARGLGR